MGVLCFEETKWDMSFLDARMKIPATVTGVSGYRKPLLLWLPSRYWQLQPRNNNYINLKKYNDYNFQFDGNRNLFFQENLNSWSKFSSTFIEKGFY